MSTTLYRLFDGDLRLLYVGIAGNPGRRFEQHANDKPWWPEVAHIRTQHCGSRAEAVAAEVIAIKTENPLHNVVHASPEQMTRRPPVQRELELFCTGCGKPGADYLEVDDDAAARRIQAKRDQSNDRIADDSVFIEAASMVRLEPRVKWQAWHRACDPQPSASNYWFDADRVKTYVELLEWTAHLMGKNWFEHTDWPGLLYGVIHGHGPLRRAAS